MPYTDIGGHLHLAPKLVNPRFNERMCLRKRGYLVYRYIQRHV